MESLVNSYRNGQECPERAITMSDRTSSEQNHHVNEDAAEGAFQLSEAHQMRNKRILEKLASSSRKVSKEEAYRQYDMIKANSNRSRSQSEDR